MYQILFIFILPVVLIYFRLVPIGWRYSLLAVSALLIYGIMRHERWSYKEIGFRTDNLKRVLRPYLYATITGFVLLAVYDRYVGIDAPAGFSFYANLFLFFLPVSFLQEFGFRSFLMPRLKKIFGRTWEVIAANALLFALMHVIYPVPSIGLPLAFISGFGFAAMYYYYPNLILITLCHAVLNLTAVMLGFFHLQ